MQLLSASEWDDFLAGYPDAHILQSSAWGELKAAFGWRSLRLRVGDTGAQVLFRRLPLGISLAYLPKGPVGKDWGVLWPQLDAICRQQRAVFLKVEPDAWHPLPPQREAEMKGFFPDAGCIQPRRTVVIALDGAEDDWLERMKQKTRYNIRLAQRKGVIVRPSADLASFYRMVQITGNRDGFGVHTDAYYQLCYDRFVPRGEAVLLIAEYNGRPLAGIMVFGRGKRAWYFYGASNDEERNRMPAYLLQWEAMRWAAERGCQTYDLWGIPDLDEEELEKRFEQNASGLWGVYRFKRGFGGQVMRAAAAWERVYNTPLYFLYRRLYARRATD